jgi:hypothetical protein
MAASGLFALAAVIHGQAERAGIVDNAQDLMVVSAALGDACVSRESPDIKNCATAIMSSTLSVANSLEFYLNKDYPDHAATRILGLECSMHFSEVAAKYKWDSKFYGPKSTVPDYFRSALSVSNRCLQAIETVSMERGLTYMPSVTSFLQGKINDAQHGKIIIGWHI